MNRRHIISSITLCAASLAFGSDEIPPVRFLPSSPLSSGTWVKIGVEDSGIYEISYSALQSMGFADPSAVCVFGYGGAETPLNFRDDTGRLIYSDELKQIPVIRQGNKLYFYGRGTTEFTLNPTDPEASINQGHFVRKSHNIYSFTGAYFLTDSAEPQEMRVLESNPLLDIEEIPAGSGRIYYEKDLYHNVTDSGQLFYGECISEAPGTRLEWPVTLPGAIEGGQGIMECVVYFDYQKDTEFSYGLVSDNDPAIYDVDKLNSTSVRHLKPTRSSVSLSGEEDKVFVSLDVSPELTPANLDYWVLTYDRNIPDLRSIHSGENAQDFIAFPEMRHGQRGFFRIPGGKSLIAVNISNPESPVRLPFSMDEETGIAEVEYSLWHETPPEVIVFDPLQPQMQIKGFRTDYSLIANQDLHARAAAGAELLIICTSDLEEVAEELGAIHEENDGISVMVAPTDKCYNEYSGGVPSPMAYRALVRSLKDSPRPVKNVLLLGPLQADFRGMVTEHHPDDAIIAFQAAVLSQDRGAHNANDFVGMTADRLDLDNLHANRMEVGVGILPVRYPAEAEIVVEKIRNFYGMENEFPYYLNRSTSIGGIDNAHAHEEQAIQLSSHIDRLSNYGNIATNLPIDAYGFMEAQRIFFENLNEGRMLVTYFGHGSGYRLNLTGNFFRAADVYRLRNRILPFMGFAGCSLTNSDRGCRGMGESLVVSTPYGMLGTLLATRETWSAENGTFFNAFFTSMFRETADPASPRLTSPITLGEVFAKAKNSQNNNNELGYQLLCDPALTLPVPTREVNFRNLDVNFKTGERNHIAGYVAGPEGNGAIDEDFSGKAVIRVMRPAETIISANLCTNDPTELRFKVYDNQIAMAVADIENGHFSTDIFIPVSARAYSGPPARLQVAVYDPVMRIGGGGMQSVFFSPTLSDEEQSEPDTLAPVIEHLAFNPDTKSLEIRVSDNVALSYATEGFNPYFRLTLDGTELADGLNANPIIEADCEAYTKSIHLGNLTEGEHQATVTIRDASGNVAEGEVSFSYYPAQGRYAIRLENGVAARSAIFIAETDMPSSADLVVIDMEGNEIHRGQWRTEGYEWDLLDKTGHRVSPGIYRAFILETGRNRRKGHSTPIEVPVV